MTHFYIFLTGYFTGMVVTFIAARWSFRDAIDKHYPTVENKARLDELEQLRTINEPCGDYGAVIQDRIYDRIKQLEETQATNPTEEEK